MTSSVVLRKVKQAYPEAFTELPRPKLRLIESAILFASRLGLQDDVLSAEEHKELLRNLTGKSELSSADRLKAYRYRQDLTQVELARRTGISQSNISAMEAGRRPIGVLMAKKLAGVLKCDYRRLL